MSKTFVPLSFLEPLVGLSTLFSLEVRSPHMNGRVVVRSCGRLLCTSCVRFSCGGGVSFSYVVTLAAWTICWLVASPFGLSAGTSYDSLLPVQWSVWHRPSIFRIGHCMLVTWVRLVWVLFILLFTRYSPVIHHQVCYKHIKYVFSRFSVMRKKTSTFFKISRHSSRCTGNSSIVQLQDITSIPIHSLQHVFKSLSRQIWEPQSCLVTRANFLLSLWRFPMFQWLPVVRFCFV